MTNRRLVQENILFLKQGINLVRRLSDDLYQRNDPKFFASCVGKHIRHNTDHYDNFLDGIEKGKINYDERLRDAGIELNRHFAIRKFEEIITRLENLENSSHNQPVLINSNEGEGGNSSQNWHVSTIGRELQFLLSHTVHHYALVAMILRLQGFETGKDFGVAPSTLKFERSKENEKTATGA
jgi:uncharacterized damage-inducible protein DinB